MRFGHIATATTPKLDALRAQLQGGGSSASQTQSTTMDPTSALMSKDANVRKAALSQMNSGLTR